MHVLSIRVIFRRIRIKFKHIFSWNMKLNIFSLRKKESQGMKHYFKLEVTNYSRLKLLENKTVHWKACVDLHQNNLSNLFASWKVICIWTNEAMGKKSGRNLQEEERRPFAPWSDTVFSPTFFFLPSFSFFFFVWLKQVELVQLVLLQYPFCKWTFYIIVSHLKRQFI